MRNPGGYAHMIMPRDGVVNFDGVRKELVCEGVFEADTFTCFHCNRIAHVPVKPDVNAVGFCRNCFRAICEPCSAQPCRPFEQALEAEEARGIALRSYGF